jgi:glutamine synthetase
MVTINTILAEALDYLATEIELLVAGGSEFDAAVQKVLEDVVTNHGAIVYNGDGYTDEWQTEAAARGLKNLRTTPDALPELVSEESMQLFSHYGVFSHREMHSRYDVALEQYTLSVGVEARLTLKMATTIILPAATRYQTELAANIANLRAIGADTDTAGLDEVSQLITKLRAGIAALRSALAHTAALTVEAEATHAGTALLPAMAAARAAADELEAIVADDLWPLATYQEMLFIL